MLKVCFRVNNGYHKSIIPLIVTIHLRYSGFNLGAKNTFSMVFDHGNFTRLDKGATKTIKNDKMAELFDLCAGNHKLI